MSDWEKPGNVIINISSKDPVNGYFRINDYDLMKYHQIGIYEWYSKTTTIMLIDGSILKVPLSNTDNIINSNMLIKLVGLGLPQESNPNATRGNLYIQLLIIPPDPMDIEVDDLPQFIKIVGSVPSISENNEVNTGSMGNIGNVDTAMGEISDEDVSLSENNIYEVTNCDESV